MQRVCHAPSEVKTYLEDPDCLVTPETRQCPFCSDRHPLRLHGWYGRHALLPGTEGAIVVPVRRLLCPRSGTTVSLLPDFCLPRRQHGPGILGIFLHALALGATLLGALRKARPDAPGYSTAQALRSGFLRRARAIRVYLAALQYRMVTPPQRIPAARRPLARLVFPLLGGFPRDPVRAFMIHGLRFHRRFQKGLA